VKPFETLAEAIAPGGARLSLHRRDADLFLHVDGAELMSTRRRVSEEQLADLALERAPAKAEVLIGGLGLGFTLRRVLERTGPVSHVAIAELVPAVVEWNRLHLAETTGKALLDPRVQLHVADVHQVLLAARPRSIDALLLDVDNGPGPLVKGTNRQLYDRPGLQRLSRLLAKGGRAVFWSARAEPRFEERLREVGFDVRMERAKTHGGARRSSHSIYVADAPAMRPASGEDALP